MSEENFYTELEHLINKYCIENESNTPDFMLAEYILNCLKTFSTTINKRDAWYGINEKM
jgi:hypothetical protein